MIPLIEVAGSPFAAGAQIGEACREDLVAAIGRLDRIEQLRERSRPYDAALRTHLPRVAEELDGCARGAGVDPLDLLVYGTEELFTGCTDVAARHRRRPAT